MKRNSNLLNAMHGGLVDLNQSAFDQSLVLNVLFQDRLIIWGGSFFTSMRLLQHLQANKVRKSIFEVACENGVIVPAFYDATTGCLQDFAEAGRKLSPGFEMAEFRPVRDRVIHAVDRGISHANVVPLYWPANEPPSSVGYDKAVRGLMQRDQPPEHVFHNKGRALRFGSLWDASKPWRVEVIEVAARMTRDSGGLGLRQQHVYNALGASLGGAFSRKDLSYNDLMSLAGADTKVVSAFLKWLAQCHFVNQAQGLGVSINFPIYDHDEDFVLDSILRTRLDKAPDVEAGFRHTVSLPSLKALARLNAADLMGIRTDFGPHYLQTLAEWQASPSETTESRVKDALGLYSSAIVARYADLAPPIKVDVKIGNAHIDKLIGLGVSVAAMWTANAYLNLINIVSSGGFAVYSLVKERKNRRNDKHELRDVEVTMPLT